MTATATAAKITYRKTKSGEWVAYGPASAIKPGAVTVTKKSGETKTERIERVGRPFTVDGQQMAYGYLAASAPAARTYSAGSYSRRSRSYSCDDCQMVEDCGDCGGCSRHRGNPQN